MKKNRTIILLSVLAIFLAGGCATKGPVRGAQPPAVITEINITDNAVEIKAGAPFEYTVYKPSDPFRVAVDLPGVSLGKFTEKIASKSAGITEVEPSQTETPALIAKLEILLQFPGEIEPLYKDNVLVLNVKAPAKKEAGDAAIPLPIAPLPEEKVEIREAGQEEAPKAEAPATTEEAPLPPATEITDIGFEQAEGLINIVIKGNGSMNPSVFTLKNRIVIDIPDVKLLAKAPAEVIVPVKGLRTGQYPAKARVVVDLKEMRQFEVNSVRDSVIIGIQSPELIAKAVPAPKTDAAKDTPQAQAVPSGEMTAPPEAKAEAKPEAKETKEIKPDETLVEGKYTGRKLSLDFQDAEIVPIFRLLADISGYNIVLHPDVKGRLTMKLMDVPWDQALDLILKSSNLASRTEGNIIRVAPHAVFAKENEETIRTRESETRTEPLETKVYPINYADTTLVEKAIKDSKMLTPRGSISLDKRTSSIIVKDVQSVMPLVEELLATLDKATPQVMIEARIVEVNTSDVSDLGIQWGTRYASPDTLGSIGGSTKLGTGVTGGNYLIDFPATIAAAAGSGFTFGLINPARTMGLDLQLSALAKVGKTKIISNPKVLTTDNVEATIMQGSSEPYPKIDATSGQISVEFKDVALTTKVTPHVTPSGAVTMVINVKKEDILGTVKIGGSDVPRTSKVEGNTTVLVQDGETIVIGGVYKKFEDESTSGLPGLMNIPVIGSLFRSKTTTGKTNELLIFITPRIAQKPQ